MKGRSIRRRLLVGVAVVQILVAVLATVLVVRHEMVRSYALLDAELEEHSVMVAALIETPNKPGEKTTLHRELLTLPRRDVYVLTDATDGGVVAASGDWRPNEPLPQGRESFANLRFRGRRYRVLVKRNLAEFSDEPKDAARLSQLMLVYGSPVGRVEEHVWHVAWTAAAMGLVLLLLSLLATGWVVRTGLQPVTQLAESAAKIDAQHWQWEPEGERVQELAPLADTLTRLVERLRAAFMRERQFSADAAHEMKTAVAIVKSTLQLALEREGSAEEYRAGVERALDDTQRMQGLVSGMLQLAKIEGLAEDGAGEQDCVNVAETLNTAMRRLTPVMEARRMLMRVELSEPAIRARISAEGLAIVVMNLLENAIHYSPDGSAVEVKAELRGELCVLSVEDHGCGIDAETLPHIFERFYRGDRSRSRESGGAGLGLAIAHAMVHRVGGSLTAVSEPGKGSIFTVQLPRG